MTLRPLAAIALLLPALALAQGRFRWDVPAEVARVPVPGTQVANGIPVRLEVARSKWTPSALYARFQESFQRAGLYVPPSTGARPLSREPTLTGLDPETRISYTVILQANADGTTSCILGEAHSAEAVPMGEVPAPLFPAAEAVVRTEMEGGRVVGYTAAATPDEVQRFYREVLGATGYAEEPKGTFTSRQQVLKVRVGKPRDGKVQVTVLSRPTAPPPERPYVAPGKGSK